MVSVKTSGKVLQVGGATVLRESPLAVVVRHAVVGIGPGALVLLRIVINIHHYMTVDEVTNSSHGPHGKATTAV